MPNIPDYNPRNRALTPESKGQEATEIAGRRVGPLYNQAGEDVRERAKLTALGIRQRLWPFDIQALMEGRSGGGGGGDGGGSGFRVRGGGDSGGGSSSPSLRDHSRAGRGASQFSGIANGLIRGRPTEEVVNEDLYMRYTQSLEHGNLVWRDNRTGQVLNKPRPNPNAEAFEQAQAWYNNEYKKQQEQPIGNEAFDDSGKPIYLPREAPRGGVLDLSPYQAPSSSILDTVSSWWGSMFDAGNAFSGYEGP